MEQEDLNKKAEEVGTVGMIFGFVILAVLFFVAVKVLIFIWGAVSGALNSEQVKNDDVVQEVVSEQMQEVEETETSRCLAVPDVIVTRLNDGLNMSGGSIKNLSAVKSTDFSSVYFISGELDGPGLEREGDIATFMTNKLDYDGATFSADAIATEFSDWPDITKTNVLADGGVSLGALMSSDGFKESRECVFE